MSESKGDYDAKEIGEGKEDDFKQAVDELSYFSRKYGSTSSSSANANSSGKTTRMRGESKLNEDNEAEAMDEDTQRDLIRREVDENRSTVDLLRQELENYLGKLDAKTDSEGNKLISVPDNFGSIVNAMTREDLSTSKEKESWVQYLLSDHVNQQMHRDHQGRYDTMLKMDTNKQDAQIKKGLAEILLLDRQLHSLTRKKTQIDKDNSLFMTHLQDFTDQLVKNNTHQDEHDLDAIYEDDDDTESRTSQSMAGTPSSTNRDRTFLTKQRSNASTGTTPRSARMQAGKKKGPLSARLPDGVGVSRGSPTKTSAEGKEADDFEDDDEQGVGKIQPHHLTEMQKHRIEELLDFGDDDLDDYIPKELQQQDEKVTHELERFGRLDRLDVEDNLKEVLEQEKKTDFLAQQRKDRKHKEHEKKIEQLLKMCSNDPIDYSLIAVDDEAGDAELENDTASKKSSGCRSMYSKALHEVPPVEDVHMEVPITRSDILTLLENLKQSMAKGSTRPAISSLTNDEAFAFHNDLSTVISPSQRSTRETPRSMLPTSPLTAGFSTSEGEPTIATREEIEQLLTTYRMEITRLSLAKYRKMASREEAQRKQKLEERGTTEFADDDEEDTDLSSLRKSSNQQKTPRSERPEKQTKSNLQPPIEKKTSPSPRKTPRQQAAAMMNQFTLESNMYQQQQFQQQQQQQFSLSRQQEESYHKNQSAEFIGKVFDDDDLKMLPDLLRDDKTISLPPIPSARDAQGNKKPTIQFNPPVPILQTSRRVKQRPTSNGGGSAKSSARDAEFNPYRMPYDDNDNDEQQYDPSDHYDYDYNYGTKYADDDQEDGKEHNNDEDEDDYAQQRKKKSSEALRQSLVDQVRRVVEC